MAGVLRIGIIGAGANTRDRHIPGFRALPDVEVTAVANRTPDSSRRAARDLGIVRTAAHWREIVEDPAIDAVCIGTWPYLHAEVACAALAAGKHVLTEARMARNLPEAEAMLAAARARPDLVAQVVPSPLTLPVDAAIRELIATGALGDIREVGVTHTTALYADPAAPLTWRQDFELSGHNTLTLGIYYEAVLRWMQEDAQVVAADAAIFTPERIRPDGTRAAVRIPESLTVLGRYGRGARLVMHLSGVETIAPRNEARIQGAAGGLRLDVARGELWHRAGTGEERRVEFARESARGWRVEADFVDSIRDGAPVRLTDFATGVRTMRFTDNVWAAWSRAAAPKQTAAPGRLSPSR